MKYLSPLVLSLLLAACAVTPEDQQDAHQRKLAKEARANFIAMKQQEHPGRAVVLNDEARPTPKPELFAFGAPQPTPSARTRNHAASASASQSGPAFVPTSFYAPPPKQRTQGSADGTVYYWQVPPPAHRTTPRQQAAEARYARELAKRPENLTPEEKLWAHEHY